jgi:hypothetical protein
LYEVQPQALDAYLMSGSNRHTSFPLPLCVGLNGTLVYGNLLWEAVLQLLKHQPWRLLWLPFWGVSGRARFATRVAQRTQLMPAYLLYRQDVLTLA